VSRSAVAVGGPPGSGKSTAGRLVAETLHLEFRSAGEAFRAEAQRRGLDLAAFGRYAETHPEVDLELDRRMQRLARPGVLLEGRIQGPLCRRAGVPVEVVVVTADPKERARRVAARDGLSVEAAASAIALREESERSRYRRYYGIDLASEPADLVVDTTSQPAVDVARTIVEFLNGRWA